MWFLYFQFCEFNACLSDRRDGAPYLFARGQDVWRRRKGEEADCNANDRDMDRFIYSGKLICAYLSSTNVYGSFH